MECDSVSSEVSYGNLVDIVDVISVEKTPSTIIEEFIQNNFELLAQEYKTDPIIVKRKIKQLPTIGRVAYRALVEFLSTDYN